MRGGAATRSQLTGCVIALANTAAARTPLMQHGPCSIAVFRALQCWAKGVRVYEGGGKREKT